MKRAEVDAIDKAELIRLKEMRERAFENLKRLEEKGLVAWRDNGSELITTIGTLGIQGEVSKF